MCLYTRNKVYVSDGTVVCYKILMEMSVKNTPQSDIDISNIDIQILTPFVMCYLSKDVFDGTLPLNPSSNIFEKEGLFSDDYKPYVRVEGGVIHAYLDKEEAIHFMKTYFKALSGIEKIEKQYFPLKYNLRKIVLCECVIPEGKRYFKGDEEYWEVDNPRQCGVE